MWGQFHKFSYSKVQRQYYYTPHHSVSASSYHLSSFRIMAVSESNQGVYLNSPESSPRQLSIPMPYIQTRTAQPNFSQPYNQQPNPSSTYPQPVNQSQPNINPFSPQTLNQIATLMAQGSVTTPTKTRRISLIFSRQKISKTLSSNSRKIKS